MGSTVAGLVAAAVVMGSAGMAWAGTSWQPTVRTPGVMAATTTTASALVPPPVGVQFHGLWSSYTDAQRGAILDKLKAAGVTSVRIDLSWIMLQPTGPSSYDAWGVGFADKVIAMANARGMKPLMTLWLTPAWANGAAGDRVLPTNSADYARVAQWAATRWRGKVIGWEIWNEENDPGFMTGADPTAYVRLLKAAYPALHAGDPAAAVVFGGLQYNDTTWLSRAYDAGAQGYFDVLATHPYQGIADADPATPDDGTMWTLTHAAAVHQLMVARGDGAKSIWFTEMGWSTHVNTVGAPNWQRGVSEATQAAYLSKTATLMATQMPYVTRLYWYADRDTTVGDIQYNNYGLFRLDLSAKPALTALAASNALTAK